MRKEKGGLKRLPSHWPCDTLGSSWHHNLKTMSEPVSFFGCAQDAVALAKDIALIAGACVAMYVGYKGLKTWQEKLVGEHNFELARRLLLTVYSYRDAILAARTWHRTAAEVNKAKQEANGEETEEAFLSSVYHGRLRVAAEARRQLEAQLNEAEVLWGTDPTTSIVPLSKLESELIFAVQLHLRREWSRGNEQQSMWEEVEQQFGKYEGVLVSSMGPPTEQETAFEQCVRAAASTFADDVKPYLPQR